ncbi:dihydropteroate synthase [Chloroflexota bacterium]
MNKPLAPTRCGNAEFRWGEKTYVMGVCNLSPDSFSGDGLGSDMEAIVAQATRFVAEGADIIDIGGESTRPGTEPLPGDDITKELELVIPAIARLAGALPVPVSIDTYKSAVADRAVKAGAAMINDIWGLKRDPVIAQVAAEARVPIILMGNQRDAPTRVGIMSKVISELERSISVAVEAGITEEKIIIDPGIGFGKSLEQNLEIINRLAELKSLGKPILLGTSRKSVIGLTLDLPADQRMEGTAATVAIGIANGADIVRVHDVKEMVRVCRMSDAIIRRGSIID